MCPWGYRATWKDAEGKDHREKMRIFSEQEGEKGKKAAETVKRLAAPYGFRAAVRGFRSTDPCKLDFATFRRGVEEFVNAER